MFPLAGTLTVINGCSRMCNFHEFRFQVLWFQRKMVDLQDWKSSVFSFEFLAPCGDTHREHRGEEFERKDPSWSVVAWGSFCGGSRASMELSCGKNPWLLFIGVVLSELASRPNSQDVQFEKAADKGFNDLTTSSWNTHWTDFVHTPISCKATNRYVKMSRISASKFSGFLGLQDFASPVRNWLQQCEELRLVFNLWGNVYWPMQLEL